MFPQIISAMPHARHGRIMSSKGLIPEKSYRQPRLQHYFFQGMFFAFYKQSSLILTDTRRLEAVTHVNCPVQH